MIDLSQKTIKRLFEEQVSNLTKNTLKEDVLNNIFDFQLSGGWIR